MATLKSVSELVTDGNWIESKDQSDSGIRLIQTGNIGIGEYLDKSNRAKFISEETFFRLKCTEVLPGDILISRLPDPIGRACIVPQQSTRAITAVDCTIVRLNNEILNSRFFLNYAQSPKYFDQFRQFLVGTTRTRISRKNLEKIEVPTPTLDKQRQIAAVLDSVSGLISLRGRQLAKLDELVRVRFTEMFGDQKYNPMKWRQATIGECCTLKSGMSLPADLENEGGSIPYVKVGDMNYPGNEYYVTTSSRFVSKKTAGSGIFPCETVIFPKRGGAIGTNKKRITKLPICADLNVMGVIAGDGLLPSYLMAFFETIDLGSLNNGSSVPQINNKDIAPLVICLPPLNIQREFSVFAEQTHRRKAAIQESLGKLEMLKKLLMQKYFG